MVCLSPCISSLYDRFKHDWKRKPTWKFEWCTTNWFLIRKSTGCSWRNTSFQIIRSNDRMFLYQLKTVDKSHQTIRSNFFIVCALPTHVLSYLNHFHWLCCRWFTITVKSKAWSVFYSNAFLNEWLTKNYMHNFMCLCM